MSSKSHQLHVFSNSMNQSLVQWIVVCNIIDARSEDNVNAQRGLAMDSFM